LRHKTLFNLGIVYRRVGDLTSSIDRLKEAVQACTKKELEAATQNNLGLSYFEGEDPNKTNYVDALSHFKKAH
jgi:TPR repeat protein